MVVLVLVRIAPPVFGEPGKRTVAIVPKFLDGQTEKG